VKINLVNENTVIVYFGDTVSIEIAEKISHAYRIIKANLQNILLDITPSYSSLLLSCDLQKVGLRDFINQLHQSLLNINYQSMQLTEKQVIVLPVYYGEEVALDHETISQHTQLPFSEIIRLHTAETYHTYAIGFAPGFAYLGNTNPLISIPRKSTPRKIVPTGSVGIADQQTAIYPNQSPGGWQIIGRTPTKLFDITQPNLSQFEIGSKVKFEAIDRMTFLNLGGQIDPHEHG